MSIDTDYYRWRITTGAGFSAGLGVFSGTIAGYTLTGYGHSGRESFGFNFGGIGVGAAAGVELHLGTELLMSGAGAALSTTDTPVSCEGSPGVWFAGSSRSARNFDGPGTIFDFSAGIGITSGIQVILFGLIPNHAQLAVWGKIAYDIATGRRRLDSLIRSVPAVTMIASAGGLGAGAAVTSYTGYFSAPGAIARSRDLSAPVAFASYGSPRVY
jgi:hypothetical protein